MRISAHVNGVDVEVCPGGWKKDVKKIDVLRGTLPGRSEYGKMKPQDIREAMNMLRSLSKLNRLHRS